MQTSYRAFEDEQIVSRPSRHYVIGNMALLYGRESVVVATFTEKTDVVTIPANFPTFPVLNALTTCLWLLTFAPKDSSSKKTAFTYLPRNNTSHDGVQLLLMPGNVIFSINTELIIADAKVRLISITDISCFLSAKETWVLIE